MIEPVEGKSDSDHCSELLDRLQQLKKTVAQVENELKSIQKKIKSDGKQKQQQQEDCYLTGLELIDTIIQFGDDAVRMDEFKNISKEHLELEDNEGNRLLDRAIYKYQYNLVYEILVKMLKDKETGNCNWQTLLNKNKAGQISFSHLLDNVPTYARHTLYILQIIKQHGPPLKILCLKGTLDGLTLHNAIKKYTN